MTAALPPDARCALHPDVAATFGCPRCGSFACAACDRRTRPEATPMCPACWERRGAHVAPIVARNEMALPNTVLGVGVAALIPCIWPFQVGTLIAGGIALSRLEESSPPAARTRILIGMGLACVGLLESVLVLFFTALAGAR